MNRLRIIVPVLAFVLALSVGTVSAQVTPFSTDVASAINSGLAWLDSVGGFTGSASSASGLTALALLEKRADANYLTPSQGYDGASVADKARLDSVMGYIVANDTATGFYAYRDGADMMALSVYLLSKGGISNSPSQASALATLKAIYDRTVASQNGGGYWCYNDGGCNDASTTQLVVAGLAAARGVFGNTDPFYPTFADAGRLASLNAAASLIGSSYAANGLAGEGGSACGVLTSTERGHGYNLGHGNSLQQTSSGTWVQLVGGSNVNSAGVQAYLQWIRNRYRYSSLGGAGGGWDGLSHYYYLWSSSKAYSFIEDGIPATVGNLDPSKLGILAPGSAPACGVRELHRSPAADSRIGMWGAGGPGYYNPGEAARWYYDYAYTLLSDQGGTGYFSDPNGGWESYSNQSYAILVLERSTGGGCADSNLNHVCDDQEALIQLNTATTPSTGQRNVTNVNLTGVGFPAFPANVIPAATVNVIISASCGGAPLATTTALSVVNVLGSSRRISFKIPAGSPTGTVYVSTNGVINPHPAGQLGFASTNCSKLIVTP